jgi:flagellar biosynthesis/type III secretory pathway protein FliH
MHETHILKNESIQGTIACSPEGEVYEKQTKEDYFQQYLKDECQKAYRKGKEEGIAQGYIQSKDEMAAFLELIQSISSKVLEEKKRLMDQLKPEIIEFCIAVAEKIIRQELSHKEKLSKLIDSFLQLITPPINSLNTSRNSIETIKISLSPEDLELLEDCFEHFNYEKGDMTAIKFVSDPLMVRGDLRMETKSQFLNFSVNRELEDLRSKILRL